MADPDKIRAYSNWEDQLPHELQETCCARAYIWPTVVWLGAALIIEKSWAKNQSSNDAGIVLIALQAAEAAFSQPVVLAKYIKAETQRVQNVVSDCAVHTPAGLILPHTNLSVPELFQANGHLAGQKIALMDDLESLVLKIDHQPTIEAYDKTTMTESVYLNKVWLDLFQFAQRIRSGYRVIQT